MPGPGAAAAPGGCSDPLPIDPQAVVTAMGWKNYRGGQQAGPVCSLQWETKSGETVTVLMYGPTALQTLGVPAASTKAAADRYKGEGPKGVEAVPGAPDVYTVFDPKGPNRRVFVAYRSRVYMINITGEVLSVAALVKALLRS
jgi:hypothetical protein